MNERETYCLDRARQRATAQDATKDQEMLRWIYLHVSCIATGMESGLPEMDQLSTQLFA